MKKSLFLLLSIFFVPLLSHALDFSPSSEFTRGCIVTPLPRLIKGPLPEADSPDAGGFRYVIRKPASAMGLYFQVAYDSTEPVQLILEFRKGPVLARGLLPGKHTAAVYIDREPELVSFTIQSRSRNIPPKILAAGTVNEPADQCDIRIRDKTVDFRMESGATGVFGLFDISGQPLPEVRADLRITVYGEHERKSDFRLKILPGINRFYLYRNTIGFPPRRVVLEGDQVINMITGGALVLPRAANEPIPADVDTIIQWDTSLWRRNDFELFSWSVVPNIYILSFKNNDIQWQYLTRLAFHQEKRYSRGSLLTDQTLQGRQGWTAHDYSAEGLAQFFQQAAMEEFPLNRKELDLRALLLSLGVIKVSNQGEFIPGTGAIISIDQTRSEEDKIFYLCHELAHGIFFTDPQIRKEITELWLGESEGFRYIFTSFLWENSYDSTYEYLVVNEYFGYLNQMHVSELDGYFNWKITDLFPSRTANGKKIRRILWADEQQFSKAGERIEKILYRYYGLKPGQYQCLRRL